jgi:hypothetical protein
VISTIQGLLANEHEGVQCQALITLIDSMDYSKVFSSTMIPTNRYSDNLHGIIFTPNIISAIHIMLKDPQWRVRMQALQTLVASIPHSMYPL